MVDYSCVALGCLTPWGHPQHNSPFIIMFRFRPCIRSLWQHSGKISNALQQTTAVRPLCASGLRETRDPWPIHYVRVQYMPSFPCMPHTSEPVIGQQNMRCRIQTSHSYNLCPAQCALGLLYPLPIF